MPNSMSDFQRGYAQALEDINRPMRVVAKKMEPVGMPQMQKVFRRLRGLRWWILFESTRTRKTPILRAETRLE